jgi:hypothetical protein
LLAPDAVSTVDAPLQMLALTALTVGLLFTVTMEVLVATHPPIVALMVYTALAVGVTVIL